LEGNEKTL